MQIRVLENLTARLDDADNFRDFKIVAETQKDRLEDVGKALEASNAGLVKGDHAWISQAWLRANHGAGDAWDEGFSKMLDYAVSKGWLDENGNVRAHVEWA